ncbi:hypothetical protein IV494_13065 [Kaistella sp. G5-32]|uniref:Uncharacterized protein n=1 Tax=Kaistella gelatinilytica TaxID=2787636 RepID=A0ABS0FEM2_9FLAO|nr:hypothetical protein [Kaistella gelatinilytica]MBF8458107.1 hypothetical protein [Kaistella gelatinilytica]
MAFYSNFSENDLREAYKNQVDYQGKPNEEILAEIKKRGGLESLVSKIRQEQKHVDERNKIIREIHGHYMKKKSKEECNILIKSDLISESEKLVLINEKYTHIHNHSENLKIDSKTIVKSIAAIFISSILTFLIFLLFITVINFALIAFLVPIYIINYLIIKVITGKTRNNIIIFLATFFATLLSVFYLYVLVL